MPQRLQRLRDWRAAQPDSRLHQIVDDYLVSPDNMFGQEFAQVWSRELTEKEWETYERNLGQPLPASWAAEPQDVQDYSHPFLASWHSDYNYCFDRAASRDEQKKLGLGYAQFLANRPFLEWPSGVASVVEIHLHMISRFSPHHGQMAQSLARDFLVGNPGLLVDYSAPVPRVRGSITDTSWDDLEGPAWAGRDELLAQWETPDFRLRYLKAVVGEPDSQKQLFHYLADCGLLYDKLLGRGPIQDSNKDFLVHFYGVELKLVSRTSPRGQALAHQRLWLDSLFFNLPLIMDFPQDGLRGLLLVKPDLRALEFFLDTVFSDCLFQSSSLFSAPEQGLREQGHFMDQGRVGFDYELDPCYTRPQRLEGQVDGLYGLSPLAWDTVIRFLVAHLYHAALFHGFFQPGERGLHWSDIQRLDNALQTNFNSTLNHFSWHLLDALRRNPTALDPRPLLGEVAPGDEGKDDRERPLSSTRFFDQGPIWPPENPLYSEEFLNFILKECPAEKVTLPV